MTQNANESLHNTIWNLCPKAKYVSPQSVTISTDVAVTIFNEGELSVYGFKKDLQLKPDYLSFRSITFINSKAEKPVAGLFRILIENTTCSQFSRLVLNIFIRYRLIVLLEDSSSPFVWG